MALGIRASRLSLLSAGLSIAVAVTAFAMPALTILVALVSALVAVLSLFASAPAVAAPSSGAPGELLGHEAYEIVDKLGEGGIGEVFRARQLELGRFVALKRIKPKNLTREEQSRFRQEARVLAGLSNPHTINVFDAGIQTEGTLFYVMELLDGRNLRQLVEREGPIVPARVLHILHQATLSLIEAHERDFVHRDLNPSNLMICRYGGDYDFVKVLDFGLVKSMTQRPSSEDAFVTQTGELPGTPAFLAPESISGGALATARTDLYALAAIGHYLLTGKYLFEAEGAVAMARAQLHEIPGRASAGSPHEVPPALDDLIARCLEKDPAARPQTAREFLSLLEPLRLLLPWTRADAEASWKDVPVVSARSEDALLPSESGGT